MLLFKNLEKFTERTLKIDLKPEQLAIIIQAMESVNIKGSDAITFGALMKKLLSSFEKARIKAQEVSKDGSNL